MSLVSFFLAQFKLSSFARLAVGLVSRDAGVSEMLLGVVAREGVENGSGRAVVTAEADCELSEGEFCRFLRRAASAALTARRGVSTAG